MCLKEKKYFPNKRTFGKKICLNLFEIFKFCKKFFEFSKEINKKLVIFLTCQIIFLVFRIFQLIKYFYDDLSSPIEPNFFEIGHQIIEHNI